MKTGQSITNVATTAACGNYRPKSMFPVVAKVFEKMVCVVVLDVFSSLVFNAIQLRPLYFVTPIYIYIFII